MGNWTVPAINDTSGSHKPIWGHSIVTPAKQMVAHRRPIAPTGEISEQCYPQDFYITIDDAITKILTLGPGALIAKIDIRNAFRMVPVHPADRHLLAMRWRNGIFIDTCLPFGLRSSSKLFNILADLLAWILVRQGITVLLH